MTHAKDLREFDRTIDRALIRPLLAQYLTGNPIGRLKDHREAWQIKIMDDAAQRYRERPR